MDLLPDPITGELACGSSDSQATYNATMDVAVAKEELLANTDQGIATSLGVNEDKVPVWESMLAKMPEYMLNEDGIIKEWLTRKAR
jgi:alpha-L-fucosidase 2